MTSTKRIHPSRERTNRRVSTDASTATGPTRDVRRSRGTPPGARGRREEKKNMRVIASDERRASDIARASDIGRIGCTIRRRVYSRDIRLIIHHRSIARRRKRASAETRVASTMIYLFIYLGDDGRRSRRLGRLGGDDGGERELGRERRGEHGVDRSRCDDRSVVSFRSVVSVGRFGRFERVKRAAGGMMM